MTVEEVNDVAILISAIKETHLILGQYIEPGLQDLETAVNEVFETLGDLRIYDAMKRLEQNEQLKQLG